MPQVQTKKIDRSLSQVNGVLDDGKLNENLIEQTLSSSVEPIECDAIDHCTNIIQNQNGNQPPSIDRDVEDANKTIVALSILIQHLTVNVSKFFRFVSHLVGCSVPSRINYSVKCVQEGKFDFNYEIDEN